jgi:serine protease inhibitor
VTTPTPPRLVASDVRREVATETAAAAETAIGMRAFAHRLLSEHPELFDGTNAVMSPASIGTAFAMLRAGATGQTAAQIDAVLGFPSSGLGPAYNLLTGQWAATREDGPELAIANSLFVRDGYALEPDFLDALARDFGAGVRTVDFTGDAARVINAWVRQETRDRIDRLFDELSPTTRLVIANAIYLRAEWVSKFAAGSTHDGMFRRAAAGSVRVPFLHQTANVDYVRRAEWSAVRLPYRGGDLSMWVLLPEGGANPVGLLSPTVLAEAAEKVAPTRVALALPKWDFQSDLALNAALRAMGMPRAFTDVAEFPGVSAEPLKIDQVMHRADITVDEEGTEAAAATGISMVPVAAVMPQVSFDADHPFAFVVLHDATGSPLFEGVVGDPSVAP